MSGNNTSKSLAYVLESTSIWIVFHTLFCSVKDASCYSVYYTAKLDPLKPVYNKDRHVNCCNNKKSLGQFTVVLNEYYI